jgi:hypothetical protein
LATDATGTPTSPDNIPTFNVDADAPSGLGSNAQMAAIQAALSARINTPAGIVTGEVPVWNGSTWVRSSVQNFSPSGLSGYPNDITKKLHGDGSWVSDELAYAQITANVSITGTSLASANAIVSSGTVTFDGKPIVAEFFTPAAIIPAGLTLSCVLFDAGSAVATWAIIANSTTGTAETPVFARLRFTPTAGSHNYLAEAYLSATGTGTILAGTGTGGATAPSHIRLMRAN